MFAELNQVIIRKMRTFIETLTAGNPLLKSAHAQVEYYIARRVDTIVEREEKRRAEENIAPMTRIERALFIDRAKAQTAGDYLKAVGNYCKQTDSFTVTGHGSRAGVLEINATVERDGETYFFNTELILAGGHNIQCLHYRYIVKTNLPKEKVNEVAERIKKVAKIETAIRNLRDAFDYRNRMEIEAIEAEFTENADKIKRSKYYLKDAEKTVEKARKKLEELKK